MATITEIFSAKMTENGDKSFNTTGNHYLDILFMTEYYKNHINELPRIGNDSKSKLFAMFMRDPRYGMGCRNIGRQLMKDANVALFGVVFAGRYDDLWKMFYQDTDKTMFYKALDYLYAEISEGNELAKKWMPRYSSKNLMVAREIAAYWHMNKQQYGHFIKASSTVEYKMSCHQEDDINFSHIPSLAAIKYNATFKNKPIFAERYSKYLEAVKKGEAVLHVSTSTPYDLYKNANTLGADVDIFFDKLEKISGNWMPIVDTSGSMRNMNDCFGKALAIGHYLSKCSTYMPGKVISFSNHPQLITLGVDRFRYVSELSEKSTYAREINSMYTGDYTNTDFRKVMRMLQNLDKDNAPEYLVVLSDMEFDDGSCLSKDETMQMFAENGFNTKIIWWNFNDRNKTVPETDNYGNIYISGYNPLLLKYLESGFNGEMFLNKLLDEYKNTLNEKF